MPTKKKDSGQSDGLETHPGINTPKTGDPFFDDPPEKFWGDGSPAQSGAVGETVGRPHRQSVDQLPSPIESETDGIKELNKLYVPLAELRMRIATLQGMGITKIPMGALLIEIRKIYRASIASDE